jgi:hypothetical protein
MKRRGKPFEQVELPVESEDGFKCEKCNGFFETRNLLQRHLEHGKGGCGGKCYGDAVGHVQALSCLVGNFKGSLKRALQENLGASATQKLFKQIEN